MTTVLTTEALQSRQEVWDSLSVQIYTDGASIEEIERLAADPLISGITTNPTLMKKAGVTRYEEFARDAIDASNDKPISFEVTTDDSFEMRQQALRISKWGKNVFVKIPVVTQRGEFCTPVIHSLQKEGVKVNITAVLTAMQVNRIWSDMYMGPEMIISIFAGRIADTGEDPECLVKTSKGLFGGLGKVLWASVREPFAIIQANRSGADIVTVPPAVLEKAKQTFGKDTGEFSKETVQMFLRDAQEAGLEL